MNVEKYIVDSKLLVYVSPNSKITKIKTYDKDKGVLVDISEPADKNKANLELVKFFSKLLKKKVRIKKGLKSKEKVLLIH